MQETKEFDTADSLRRLRALADLMLGESPPSAAGIRSAARLIRRCCDGIEAERQAPEAAPPDWRPCPGCGSTFDATKPPDDCAQCGLAFPGAKSSLARSVALKERAETALDEAEAAVQRLRVALARVL